MKLFMIFFCLLLSTYSFSEGSDKKQSCLEDLRKFFDEYKQKYPVLKRDEMNFFLLAQDIIQKDEPEAFMGKTHDRTAYDYIDELYRRYEVSRFYGFKLKHRFNGQYPSEEEIEDLREIRSKLHELGVRPFAHRVPLEEEIREVENSKGPFLLSKVIHIINSFIENGENELLVELVDNAFKSDINESLPDFLNFAIENKNFYAVKFFIERSKDFNARMIKTHNLKKLVELFIENPHETSMIKPSKVIHTPLMIAAMIGDYNLFIKFFSKVTIEVNALSREGETTLDLLTYFFKSYRLSKKRGEWKRMIDFIKSREGKLSSELPKPWEYTVENSSERVNRTFWKIRNLFKKKEENPLEIANLTFSKFKEYLSERSDVQMNIDKDIFEMIARKSYKSEKRASLLTENLLISPIYRILSNNKDVGYIEGNLDGEMVLWKIDGREQDDLLIDPEQRRADSKERTKFLSDTFSIRKKALFLIIERKLSEYKEESVKSNVEIIIGKDVLEMMFQKYINSDKKIYSFVESFLTTPIGDILSNKIVNNSIEAKIEEGVIVWVIDGRQEVDSLNTSGGNASSDVQVKKGLLGKKEAVKVVKRIKEGPPSSKDDSTRRRVAFGVMRKKVAAFKEKFEETGVEIIIDENIFEVIYQNNDGRALNKLLKEYIGDSVEMIFSNKEINESLEAKLESDVINWYADGEKLEFTFLFTEKGLEAKLK